MSLEFKVSKAYEEAEKFAKSHYENFPVVSFLIPKNLRKHVASIYWFARTADDISDEGDFLPEERLKKLNSFENRLAKLLVGEYRSNYEAALHNTIKVNNLSAELFYDLLTAFKQDVTKKRYNNFDEVLGYCKNSAGPVGRLILELFDIRDKKAFEYSDKICTALQLTNFYQDTIIDYEKGRIYFPLDEMKKFKVDEKIFELKENKVNFKELLKYNIERTQHFFDEGKELFSYLHGRLKFEIKWTVLSGEEILKKIINNDFDVLNKRPSLSKIDFFSLLLKAII